MFAMMQCKGRRCDGIARVPTDYCAIAGRAIDDFQNDQNWNDAKSGQAAFQRALEKHLREAGDGRTCMMHVVGPGIAPKNFAVDIAPSRLSVKHRCALIAALGSQPSVVKRRLFVPSDTAAACPGTNAQFMSNLLGVFMASIEYEYRRRHGITSLRAESSNRAAYEIKTS